MNQAGRDVLRQAALDGVRQITYELSDGTGGRCGIGVLLDATMSEGEYRWNAMMDAFALGAMEGICPICEIRIVHECTLMTHGNDDHGLDFFKLADLMPVTDQ